MTATAQVCDGYVGNGAIRYACTLQHPHDGPGVAVEYPASKIRRQSWEMEQKEAKESAPEDGSPRFRDNAARLDEAMGSLAHEYDKLPAVIRSWTTGAVAQLALVELWRAANSAFEARKPFTLSRADIENLVPEKLRL